MASPKIVTVGTAAPWLRPELTAVAPADVAADNVVAPYDIRLAGDRGIVAGHVLSVSPNGVTSASGREWIAVDAGSANPSGRQRYGADLLTGVLTMSPEVDGWRWRVVRATDPSITLVSGRVGEPLDERQSGVLNRLRAAILPVSDEDVPPSVVAAAIAQIAMTGVVLHADSLPHATAALLAPDLVAHVGTPLPSADADVLAWEVRSVAQRRAALRGHAAGFALPAAMESFTSLSRPPTVSALLVTRRPHLVAAAVAAMVAQSYPELEIIVGLHGCELTESQRAELALADRPVHVVAIPGEVIFGEALGMVTSAASGVLVTKVDDDDLYGRDHVWDLVVARLYSGATVVGKGAEFVYVTSYDSTVRRRMGSEHFTDVVAGGTIMIARSDLESVGGWRPVVRSVDRTVLDRVLASGGLIYRTHGLGFVYVRHDEGHTWDADLSYFLQDPLRQWRGLPPGAEFPTR